jgi:hypothetical protein
MIRFAATVVLSLLASTGYAQTVKSEPPPLSDKEKRHYHVKRMVERGEFLRAGIASAEQQVRDSPDEWKQGVAGYSQRYASSLASNALRNTIALGIDVALHQDPRFYRLGEGSFWKRTQHAVVQTLVCKNDAGGRTFALWRVGSAYGSSWISTAWRPLSQDQPSDIIIRGSVSLSLDTASNVFKEFWPDIQRVLRRK